jgi:hypothetical protein
MRDWNVQQTFWQSQRQVEEQYDRMRAEMEKTSRAAAEQQRLRAADVLYRFRADSDPRSWLPPQYHERWSTGGASPDAERATSSQPIASQTAVEPTVSDDTIVPATVVDGAGAGDPPADYAILPFGDHAAIQALADGTLEVVVDPVKGIRAILETDDGQRFLYGQIGSLPKRRVKAGETIGFTPPATSKPQTPLSGPNVFVPPWPSMSGRPAAGQLPPPRPDVARWPGVRAPFREPVAARVGSADPPDNVVPLRRAPPPTEDEPADRRMGTLLLFGLGALLLAGRKRRR